MADYIKRNDLFVLSRDYSRNGEWEEAVPVRAIRNIPSANVAPIKHGKWVEKKGVLHPLETDGICTECGYETGFYNFFNFCPNCGAGMRKDGE